MALAKPALLRKIAGIELQRRFGDLDPEVKRDLATSLVRQWVTNDGHAGLATRSSLFWFRMVWKDDGGVDVGCTPEPRNCEVELRQRGVPEESIPALLHQLNLCQSVCCSTARGQFLEVRMDVKARKFMCPTSWE
jgi:hypothetical protein